MDAIWGGASDDVVAGGGGDGDNLFGDIGNDTYVIAPTSGWDVIGNWNEGDLIDISAFGIAGLGDLLFTPLGGGVVWVSGPNGLNVNVATGDIVLDAGDFRFV
jgi:hypothetical protein